MRSRIVAGEPTGSAGNPLAFGGLLGHLLRRRAQRAGPREPNTQSGLLVPVPEAEEIVGPWRDRLDPAAQDGVPAHITVLFPFLHPNDVDEAVAERLDRVFRSVSPFEFSLQHVAWFGRDVMYVAPEPSGRFRELTSELVAAFPECRPYGGVHRDVVPHLTVGDHGRLRDMRAAADAIEACLPVYARASEVWLMYGGMNRPWSTLRRFALGERAATR